MRALREQVVEPGGFISWQGGNTETQSNGEVKASDAAWHQEENACNADQNQGPGTASLLPPRVETFLKTQRHPRRPGGLLCHSQEATFKAYCSQG